MALGVRDDILGLVGNRICRWTRTPYCFGYACVEVEERMNRDDIIRMAREAGGRTEHIGIDIAWFEFMTESLERFAALVAAAERNRIADESKHIIKRAEQRGAEIEREACAKVCEDHWRNNGNAMECADAIRARGEE